MAQGTIAFGPTLESGEEKLAGASPHCVNVVVDGKGAVRRRPGITHSDLLGDTGVIDANGIELIHHAVGGQTVAVSGSSVNKRVYALAPGTATDKGQLLGASRATVAETEAMLVLAAGNAPRKYPFATLTLANLGGTPAYGSHVIANASRLLLNRVVDFTSQVQYSGFSAGSDTTGHETWLTGEESGFFSAEARADPVVALLENTNEVFAFGTTNVQVFAPDETYGYAPVSAREYGCCAPASVIRVDQGFAWLDHRRRFIVSDGRSYEEISGPIASAIDDISLVSDCYGYRVQEGQYDLLVWTFPSGNITYAYQVGVGWAVWSSYVNDAWGPFSVLSHHHRFDGSHENLVGTTDGKVGKLSRSAYTDFGSPVQAHVESGFVTRGTDAIKHCKAVRIAVKRGVSTTTSSLSMQLRYRDSEGPWSSPLDIDLGAAGDTNPVVVLRSLGTYRRRQWQMNFQGDEDFVLVSVSEEYEVAEV